ncbi:MAG: hypothetical protein ACREHG_00455, partial [Candidatus Saccharimonadales bacterium]
LSIACPPVLHKISGAVHRSICSYPEIDPARVTFINGGFPLARTPLRPPDGASRLNYFTGKEAEPVRRVLSIPVALPG